MLVFKDYVILIVLGITIHIGLAVWGTYAQRLKVACILDGGDPVTEWHSGISCIKLPKE